MSIYPVRLSEWYPPGDEHHDIIKHLVSSGFGDQIQGCLHCRKKHMHWQTAYAHHSLPYGYGDIWCNKKHFNNYFKKLKSK